MKKIIKFIKKRKKLSAVIIFFILVVGYFVFRPHSKVDNTPLVAVEKGSITEVAEAVGYIKPYHSSTIKSQINGVVEEMYHDEGEYVKKDTPLIKIKPAPDPADYASIYQDLADAISKEKSASIDLKRYKQALKDHIITKNYTEYILAEKEFSSARIKRILSQQKLALLDKGETTVGKKIIANIVNSPIDGYLLSRNVDIGDPVISLSSAQAATALFSIANMNDLMFEGVVDEMDAAKITLGMLAKIRVGSLPNQEILGTISRIALQSEKENAAQGANTSSSSTNSPFNVGFKIQATKLQFPKNIVLRSGYSATADVKIKTVDNVLFLPMRVIQFKDEKPYVLLPTKKDKTPKHQPVELGISDGVKIEIKSGLKVGDKVIDKPEVTATSN
ncbi:MAG: efflux RND transporter periplasmic adaptor subunit [Gammaproteobacteria bacterium]|nr:efflux RND transporter periplasmic adaptor subunit [Gammaproteobacteria bacterium]